MKFILVEDFEDEVLYYYTVNIIPQASIYVYNKYGDYENAAENYYYLDEKV